LRDVRVALAQTEPRLGDVAANLDLHLETVERAREGGADVVLFPELSLTGYVLRDQVADLAEPVDGPHLARLADAARGIDVIVGFAEDGPGHRFHNAAAYLADGRVVHVHRKVHLPTYGLFEEGRDFGAGETVRAFDGGRAGRSGIAICEDLWHPTTAWLLAQDGAEVLFVTSSGPTRGARDDGGPTSVGVWHDLLRMTAQFQTSYVVYVNRVGYEDGLNFGGGSAVIDPFGRTVVRAAALEPDLVFADLRDETLRRARTVYPLLRDADLELVRRELDRVRRRRFDLPDDDPADGS
jgi:predicted amidohydrolase